MNAKPKTLEEVQKSQLSRQVRIDSLNYLVLWKTSRAAWKFQKTRQIWLFKNIYNIERIPVKHFKILKKYIQSLPEGP